MTERLHFHFSHSCIGEGNGNPLQCSCPENPRDGVAQSRTRLKWLSSSSSSYLLVTITTPTGAKLLTLSRTQKSLIQSQHSKIQYLKFVSIFSLPPTKAPWDQHLLQHSVRIWALLVINLLDSICSTLPLHDFFPNWYSISPTPDLLLCLTLLPPSPICSYLLLLSADTMCLA